MKKTVITTMIVIILLSCLPSCAPQISAEEYNTLKSELDDAQQKISELTEDLAALQVDHESLQANYESLQERLTQSTLSNPTWPELKRFLEEDDTDSLPYVEGRFDCSGFAITLRDNAWRYGLRCAYVELGFREARGHAVNAFETSDQGLIFVDNSEDDKIAYVKTNHEYGVIALDTVKPSYIACNVNPAEFWKPLSYTTHPSPFSYGFYLEYRRRRQFYVDTVAAFNDAVNEYNRGARKWSYSQLETWHDNIEALEEDLGSIFYEPGEVVANVEAYWN